MRRVVQRKPQSQSLPFLYKHVVSSASLYQPRPNILDKKAGKQICSPASSSSRDQKSEIVPSLVETCSEANQLGLVSKDFYPY